MKKLVVFYSMSGNTKGVAQYIARKLRADIIEIETIKEYPDDHDVLVSLGKKEVETGYMPQIRPLAIDFAKYDGIILGTPIWWYTYAPAVRTFIKQFRQGLKGKTIYPFATCGGVAGHAYGDLRRTLSKEKVEQLLPVKFEESTQVTPNATLDEWAKGILKAAN